MGNEFIELQDNLIDYFEDVENKMLCDFIDVFVYGNGTQDTKVSKFSDKFLTDNGLVNAYINAMHDINNPKQYFYVVV